MVIGYLDHSIENVYRQVADSIDEDTVRHVFRSVFASPNKIRLNRYYFSITGNEQAYFTDGFFHTFKKRFTLQGLSNQFLEHLETNKHEIHMLLRKGDLDILYFRFFQQDEPEKHLGSLFTRLVHAFFPHQYCPLDAQVKEYFNLRQDSYYIAMYVVSKAYLQAAERHPEWIGLLNNTLTKLDEDGAFRDEPITDIKLLDLFYRTKTQQ